MNPYGFPIVSSKWVGFCIAIQTKRYGQKKKEKRKELTGRTNGGSGQGSHGRLKKLSRYLDRSYLTYCISAEYFHVRPPKGEIAAITWPSMSILCRGIRPWSVDTIPNHPHHLGRASKRRRCVTVRIEMIAGDSTMRIRTPTTNPCQACSELYI